MAERLVLEHFTDLKKYVGKKIGVSDWVVITQEIIDKFADATGDHQWIHTDPERAAKESPYGQTVAHGYLTVSLAPKLLTEILEVKDAKLVINSGLERLRFSSPVLSEARIRLRVEGKDTRDMPRGGLRVTFHLAYEVEGQKKAAVIADAVLIYYP